MTAFVGLNVILSSVVSDSQTVGRTNNSYRIFIISAEIRVLRADHSAVLRYRHSVHVAVVSVRDGLCDGHAVAAEPVTRFFDLDRAADDACLCFFVYE